MTKFSHLAKRQPQKLQTKRKIFKFGKVNLQVFNITLGVMIVVMGVSYLVQINGLATKGYQIKELEQQIAELKEYNSDLELEALSLQSMESVKDKVASLGLVEVGEMQYLNPTPVAVAR